MKTSKKIIVAVAGLLIAFFIICLWILRNDLRQFKATLGNKYKPVAIGNFQALDFSDKWKVKIVQGKECKLELAVGENRPLKPAMKNINGTLYFTTDTLYKKEDSPRIEARVTMPSLKTIKAASGAEVHLENFKSDSLKVILENGGVLTGMNNRIKHVSIQSSGDARVEFSDTQE